MSHLNNLNLFDDKAQQQLKLGTIKLKEDIRQLLGSGIQIDIVKKDMEILVNAALYGLDRYDGKEDGFIEKETLEKANSLFKDNPAVMQGLGVESILKSLTGEDGRIDVAQGASRLSKNIRAGLDDFAERFDQNRDGAVSASEMVFSQLDTDGDNFLSLEEARALSGTMDKAIPADKAAEMFSRFDADHDALLSRAEVQAVFNQMQKMPVLNVEEAPNTPPSAPFLKNQEEPLIKKN